MAPSASSDRRARRSAKRREQRNVAAAEGTAVIADTDQNEQLAKMDVAEAAKDGGVASRIMRIATPFRRRAQADDADVRAKERWADVAMDADVPLDASSLVGADVTETSDGPLIVDVVLTKAVPTTAEAPALATSQPEPSLPVPSPSHNWRNRSRSGMQPEPSLPAPWEPSQPEPSLPAPWELPVDGATAAAAADCNYRSKLRAGGQHAFQRTFAQGMFPMSSLSHQAGSMTPIAAPVMLPLGSLGVFSQGSTGHVCTASPVSGMLSMAGTLTPQGQYCMPHSQYPPVPPPYHVPQQMCWTQPVASPPFAPPTMAPTFGRAGNGQSPPAHCAFESSHGPVMATAPPQAMGFSNQQAVAMLQASADNEVYED